MENQELPAIAAYASSSTAYAGDNFNLLGDGWGHKEPVIDFEALRRVRPPFRTDNELAKFREEIMADQQKRRIVQVFVCDPDKNVPLEEAILIQTDKKLTDATDQELFFELEVQRVLKDHNEKRVKWLDKDASTRSGKEVFLTPARIRDLKMIVTTIAEF